MLFKIMLLMLMSISWEQPLLLVN